MYYLLIFIVSFMIAAHVYLDIDFDFVETLYASRSQGLLNYSIYIHYTFICTRSLAY